MHTHGFIGRIQRTSCALLACGLVVAATRAAAANVLVIAADGSGEFTQIADAVLVAQPGDTLLVRPGHYAKFNMGLDHSQTVIADGTGPVIVDGAIGIINGAAGCRFELEGLTAHGTGGAGSPAHGYGLWVLNCAGDIRITDCTFTGGPGQDEDEGGWHVGEFDVVITGHVAGWPAADVENVTGSIAFNHCTLIGGNGANMETFYYGDCGCSDGLPGGAGVSAVGSRIALYECTLKGGLGCDADRVGGVGGAGLDESGASDAMLSGSVLTGGKGGFADDYIGEVFGGDGGDGALVAFGSSLRWLDNIGAGGLGGGSLSNDPGAPGVLLGGLGAQTIYPGAARGLSVASPVFVAGGNAQLTITGDPGDLALLLIGTGPGWIASSKFQGEVLVQMPALPLLLGGVPASGVLQISGAVPSIAPLLATTIHLQAVVGTGVDASLTGAALLTLIDASFQ